MKKTFILILALVLMGAFSVKAGNQAPGFTAIRGAKIIPGVG